MKVVQATYKCPICDKEFIGKPRQDIMCPDCNVLTIRQFKNVGVGKIVKSNMIDVADMMINAPLPSGKDRVVY